MTKKPPSLRPIDRLPAKLYRDLDVYLARGWRRDLIASLLFARHGCRVPRACIVAVKEGRKCARACGDGCPVLDTLPKE